jgi:hypothetical protein
LIPQGEVFMSYFREDSPRVDRLEAALRDAGLDVWRDRSSLQGGDDWRAVIAARIRTARAIVICLSAAGLERRESEVYNELRLAVEAYRGVRPGVTFLIPCGWTKCRCSISRSIGCHWRLFTPSISSRGAVDDRDRGDRLGG